MKRSWLHLMVGLVALAFAGACGQETEEAESTATPAAGAGLAGTYKCVDTEPSGDLPPDPDDPPDTLELQGDGTAKLTVTNPPRAPLKGFTDEGTWSGGGGSGTLTLRDSPDATPFTVSGMKLLFPAQGEHLFTECTRA